MGLGNNRDYKTSARAITNNLAHHQKLMIDLMAQGKSREEASALALKQMHDARIQRQCKSASDITGERIQVGDKVLYVGYGERISGVFDL